MAWSIKRWRTACVAALLGLAALCAHAERIVLESYQEAEGLTNLEPQCLVQDTRALLWICTENGLFRFDGFRMHAEPLPNEAGGYLYGGRVDSQGRLWVLAEGGVFIRQDEPGGPRWTEVLKPDGKHLHVHSSQQFEIDGHDAVYALDDDGPIWTVAAGGALGSSLVVQPVALPPLQPLPGQLPPLRRRAEALWFGCGQQLCEWRDGRVQHWGADQGLPEGNWRNLLVSRDGSLWARSSSRLAHLAPGATVFKAVAAPVRGVFYGAETTIEDAQGAILTPTDHGIARWDGDRWLEWTREEGLPETLVGVLMFDAEGSLWLGASGRGAHRWVGYGQVEHWTEASGLPAPAVLDMARDGSGRLWAATAKGMAWFDTSARKFRRNALLARTAEHVYRLAVDGAGDVWWVQGGRTLSVKAGSVEPRTRVPKSDLYVVSQGDGRVYASGNNGLERLDVTDSGVRRMPVGDGKFDPRQGGRIVLDGKQERFVLTGRDLWTQGKDGWTQVRDAKGQLIDSLTATVADRTLWASGSDGLGAYTPDGAGARQLLFLPKSAFGGAAAAGLQAGPDGRLWMSTDQGIFVRATDSTWSRLDRRTGLVWNDLTAGFLADGDGSVWIATTAGLTHLLPGAHAAPLPALRLDEMAFGNRTFRTPPAEPVAWQDRFLRVTVGTAGFSRARSLHIEYRLGADAPWHTAQSSVIDLGAADPGAHVLELRTVGLSPVEGAGPVLRMNFEVRPPWWNSAEARGAYATALLILWWLSIRWLRRQDRARQRALEAAVAERTAALASSEVALRRLGEHNAQALEDERLRVSRELHDEMGQQLAALRMEVSVAKVRANSNKPVETAQLETLLGRVDRLVGTVRGLVSQLRPPALDGGLQAALEWLAAEFTNNAQLPCTVHVDPDAHELPPQTATMVFRIAQESLTNVRRHAGARSAAVSLTREGEAWVLAVSDDGEGFDPSAHRPGFGLLGMEERARLLGGSLDVQSTPGAGTRIVLRIEAASISA
jgi:signal transduction histidine kinase